MTTVNLHFHNDEWEEIEIPFREDDLPIIIRRIIGDNYFVFLLWNGPNAFRVKHYYVEKFGYLHVGDMNIQCEKSP